MIEEFLKSWEYFGTAYCAGWLLALLLSMVGVVVVARDQIFIGAAVSQASTLGIALAMWIASLGPFQGIEWLESDLFLSACAVVFSILAALFTTGTGLPGRESREALTGWVFLVGGSLSVLLVSGSPHGMEEVQRLLSSSIIGAGLADVILFAALAVVVGAFLLLFRRRALLVLTDEEMAQAVGIHPRAWGIGLSCLLGCTIGLSLRVSGMLFTFGCLVLPCLAARSLCRRTFPLLVVGPFLGVGTSVVAFVLANHWDQPPGQMTVALLCAVVALSSLASRVLKRA